MCTKITETKFLSAVNKYSLISKFGLALALFFVLFSSIGRLVFPFGDEPDYEVRLGRLNYQEKFILSPYRYTENYKAVPIEHDCTVNAGATSFWANIGSTCMGLNIEYFFIRLVLTIFVTLPLLMSVIFRRQLYLVSRLPHYITFVEWNRRLDALSLTLIYPSIIYFLGIMSEEVFVLVISFFIFVFWGSPLLISAILVLVYAVDDGNFIPVFLFVITLFLFLKIYKKAGMASVFICSLIFVLSAFFFGEEIIFYLAKSDIQSKFNEIYNAAVKKSAYTNYPLALRPIMTYMSFVFMTPAGVKSIFLYLLVSVMFVVALVVWLKRYLALKNKQIILNDPFSKVSFAVVSFVSVVTVIMCLVFVVPTHAYAKYYVFMMPFVVYFFLQFINKWKLMASFLFFSVVLFSNLLIYYIY